LGPSVWTALLTTLRGDGHDVFAPDLRSELGAGAGAYERIGERVARLVDETTVTVVHSGAGALVPSIYALVAWREQRVVFLDALMPHPERSWFDTIPRDAADRIKALAVQGLATPWPTWLPRGRLDQLLPDPHMRGALVEEAPHPPLAFLGATAPRLGRWSEAVSCSYLQLSPAYDDEAAEAAQRGWPVERLEGHHLSMMTEPGMVAPHLIRMAG
jgi:hypothetical protein